VSWEVRRIEQSGGVLDLRMLARELGYSQKHVITMFRDQVGIPPKLLARIIRFHRLVKHLRNGGGGPWADLALEFSRTVRRTLAEACTVLSENGRQQEPGGWSRVVLQVADLPAHIKKLKETGLHFRNQMETGPGGKQIQLNDPNGNPIELFEPAAR
jgi:AraC-like DNA-binding protein